MARFIPTYKPVHKGISIVNDEAFQDYKKWSKIRDPKKFNYFSDYRKVARKIWEKISEASINNDSGVYDKDFLYLIPQVIANRPFVELPNGKIKTNSHTDGNMYTPIFCNLFKKLNHFCWSIEGTYTDGYKKKLRDKINEEAPKYYFILPTLIKNKL